MKNPKVVRAWAVLDTTNTAIPVDTNKKMMKMIFGSRAIEVEIRPITKKKERGS